MVLYCCIIEFYLDWTYKHMFYLWVISICVSHKSYHYQYKEQIKNFVFGNSYEIQIIFLENVTCQIPQQKKNSTESICLY